MWLRRLSEREYSWRKGRSVLVWDGLLRGVRQRSVLERVKSYCAVYLPPIMFSCVFVSSNCVYPACIPPIPAVGTEWKIARFAPVDVHRSSSHTLLEFDTCRLIPAQSTFAHWWRLLSRKAEARHDLSNERSHSHPQPIHRYRSVRSPKPGKEFTKDRFLHLVIM